LSHVVELASLPLSSLLSTSVAIVVAIVVLVDVRQEWAHGQRVSIIEIEGQGRGKWHAIEGRKGETMSVT
jgi:hypothetical protein